MILQVSNVTFAAALIAYQKGHPVDENGLLAKERAFQELARKYPRQVEGISLKYANPAGEPFEQIEVEVSESGIRRVLPPISELMDQRLLAIKGMVLNAISENPTAFNSIKCAFIRWMQSQAIVRVIGAGRALLAAALPANRLAHGGATVFILNDRSPVPNSRLGGAIIALSASGETKSVLEIMKFALEVNKKREAFRQEPITVVGFSKDTAKAFADLCTPGYFLGIRPEIYSKGVVLRALGDLEEYALSDLFEALVVVAGLEVGINFRLGHEDLVGSATGPWY